MTALTLFLMLLIVCTSCDHSQQMIKPILPLEPTEVEVAEEAIFNPQPSEKPDFTGISSVRENDYIIQEDGSFLINNSHLIFNNFTSAMQSDVVKGYFKDAEGWITNNCGQAEREKQTANQYKIYFTNRQARTEFIQKTLDQDWYTDDPKGIPPGLDDTWWVLYDFPVIVAVDKPYFEVSFSVNDNHQDCQ